MGEQSRRVRSCSYLPFLLHVKVLEISWTLIGSRDRCSVGRDGDNLLINYAVEEPEVFGERYTINF